MQNTKIEWCDATFNPWTGCTKVSPGCANCYAEGWAKRFGIFQWGPGAPRRRTSEANWKLPLKWNRAASVEMQCASHILADPKAGCANREWAERVRRPRVFCASLADWLDDEVPIEWLADLLALIHQTPNLDWLLLTKRPKNWKTRVEKALASFAESCALPIPKPRSITDSEADFMNWLSAWIRNDGIDPIPENIWIGTTVEDFPRMDRHKHIMNIPARVHFWSVEPMLSHLATKAAWEQHGKPAWVICGGESGPKARPMNPDLARSLRDQCAAAGVPFFMKQMGGVRKPFDPIPDDLNIRQFPTP